VFLDVGGGAMYRPALYGVAELHYTKRGEALDHWTEVACVAELGDGPGADPWEAAVALPHSAEPADEPADEAAGFAPLPSGVTDPTVWTSLRKRFEAWLYRERKLRLYACPRLDLLSEPGETEAEFALRARDAARRARDAAVEELREKYAAKVERLEGRIETAEDRVEREASQYEQHRNQSLVRLGTSVLGAFLGRKTLSKTNLGKLTTTADSFGRASKHRDDVDRAEAEVEDLRAELAALEAELEAELDGLRAAWSPETLSFEPLEIAPRKSDIGVKRIALAWVRGPIGAGGTEDAPGGVPGKQ